MVIYIIMFIDSQRGPVIELVHMTETAHNKKKKSTLI